MEEERQEGLSESEEEILESLDADYEKPPVRKEEVSEVPPEAGTPGAEAEAPGAEAAAGELAELNDKYVRLYAELENYRKRVARDKEELVKYANESLIYELLPSLDTLEIAIGHVEAGAADVLLEGVQNTLRGLYRTLEKFGLAHIEAEGKPFNPEVHHAIGRVERDDMEENMVVEELRKGFLYNDKVLRASLVNVSVRPSMGGAGGEGLEEAGPGDEGEPDGHETEVAEKRENQ